MGGAGQRAWEALTQDFTDLLDLRRLTHITVRLLVAALLGGLLGFQRERSGKAAGLRTHMLVAVGAAFFVLIPQLEGMAADALSRVLQGIITGVGFLGGGIILKVTDGQRIKGLTTASGIWLTAAVGIAVGFGRLGSALLASVLAFLILGALHRLNQTIGDDDAGREGKASD